MPKGKDLLQTKSTPTSVMSTHITSMMEPVYGHNFPIWRPSLVPTIQKDPRIRYGLNLIKGPIQAFTAFVTDEEAENPMLHETIREQGIQFVFGVSCEDAKAKEFILKTLNRLWQIGLQELLLAVDWGFSCCEVHYRKGSDGLIQYDRMAHIHPFNVAPLFRKNGEIIGALEKGVLGHVGGREIPRYKMIWHVHARENHRVFGQSRLEWAFVPWHETWALYGARDIRRTWYFRNAYDGGTMRYPVGTTKTESGGTVDHRDLAVQIMSQMRTGGYRIFPNDVGPDGKTPEWDFEPPSANITPQGLMEYPETLRHEMLEALGIPPEVVESSSDGGFGSATGRKVPMMVYYSTLHSLVNYLLYDFQKFVLDGLLLVNYKKQIDYEIFKVVPLKSQDTRKDPVENTEQDSNLSV